MLGLLEMSKHRLTEALAAVLLVKAKADVITALTTSKASDLESICDMLVTSIPRNTGSLIIEPSFMRAVTESGFFGAMVLLKLITREHNISEMSYDCPYCESVNIFSGATMENDGKYLLCNSCQGCVIKNAWKPVLKEKKNREVGE